MLIFVLFSLFTYAIPAVIDLAVCDIVTSHQRASDVLHNPVKFINTPVKRHLLERESGRKLNNLRDLPSVIVKPLEMKQESLRA